MTVTINPAVNFEIKQSPYYNLNGSASSGTQIFVQTPYGQGLLQSCNLQTGMSQVKLCCGATMTIMSSKVSMHEQHLFVRNVNQGSNSNSGSKMSAEQCDSESASDDSSVTRNYHCKRSRDGSESESTESQSKRRRNDDDITNLSLDRGYDHDDIDSDVDMM